MKNFRFLMTLLIPVLTIAVVVCMNPVNAWGQYRPPYRLVTVNAEGDVIEVDAPNQGRIHTRGSLGLHTADYLRGVTRGVPQDMSDISIRANGAVMFELFHEWGPMHDGSVTVGMDNGLTNADPLTPTGNLESWYRADTFIGLETQFTGGIMAGITYTVFGSPNATMASAQEIALSLRYAGDNIVGALNPNAKLALPVDTGDGVFLQLGAEPAFTIWEFSPNPTTLAVPLVFGAGFDGYYIEDETPTFFQAGLTSATQLMSSANYGNWYLNAGVHLIVRSDDLADLGGPFDDTDSTVVFGLIGLSFMY